MQIGEILDEAKKVTGAASDSELSKKLGLTRNAVSNYRTGVSLPKAAVCEKIAKITGKSPLSVIAAVEELRAISSEDKAVWRRLAAAAFVLLAALPIGSKAAPYGYSEPDPGICIMRNNGWQMRGCRTCVPLFCLPRQIPRRMRVIRASQPRDVCGKAAGSGCDKQDSPALKARQ